MKTTKSAEKKKFSGANFKASLQKEALKSKLPKSKKAGETKSATRSLKKGTDKVKTPMPSISKTYLADPHGSEADYMKNLKENIQKNLKSTRMLPLLKRV